MTFSELVISQSKAVSVMFCAGIAVETLWQLKTYAKVRSCRRKCKGHKDFGKRAGGLAAEAGFWIGAAGILCEFLYYGSFGRVTLYSAIGFLTGLLLWKKICCGILKEVWVEKDEAENLKTTARSSISIRPEKKGWKKGGQKRRRKKKK